MADAIIRVPEEWKSDTQSTWKQLRIADGSHGDLDLDNAAAVEPFDGVALSEWLVPLSQASVPILTAILGFLIARKGELEIRDGQSVRKFKNMSPRQIHEVMAILAKYSQK